MTNYRVGKFYIVKDSQEEFLCSSSKSAEFDKWLEEQDGPPYNTKAIPEGCFHIYSGISFDNFYYGDKFYE